MYSSAPTETEKKPSKTYCEHHAECLKKIQAVLDGEATEVEKDHFRENMEECLHCIKMYHLEKCVKEVLQSKVDKKICPDNLLAAIKLKLNFTA
ncbi:MAG: hypothetical protein EAZ70_00260 [Runella slithyformis]|jgi:anti-sigma factor (TIGR02949 family)|nr:MAG: hypothetical protein EAY79_00655 [Runella slithyformis]TAF93670.1 MAG: hypothetical protein EAZ46_11815 [Runella sp.]TAG19215.1 MAG: hypothetical protein EAZ38_13005 [Cytophagales bacterium]TAG38484.1 MAG: hypothetical protein EAZ32_12370 [Cytophagia bacterium]TAE92972.1 MAG: hypothetical protein EAZ80_11890 [Runella slithyformis]